MLAEVTASATAAEKVKLEVQKVKDKAQHIVDEINREKSYAEEKLEAAKPALMEAERALQVSLWWTWGEELESAESERLSDFNISDQMAVHAKTHILSYLLAK